MFAAGSQLKNIGEFAFSECGTLKIKLPDGIETIPEKCFYENKIEEIHIPASVKTIGENAFYYCMNLQKMTFAANSQLREIGNYSFGETSLTEVQIPASVQSIGPFAFPEQTVVLRPADY